MFFFLLINIRNIRQNIAISQIFPCRFIVLGSVDTKIKGSNSIRGVEIIIFLKLSLEYCSVWFANNPLISKNVAGIVYDVYGNMFRYGTPVKCQKIKQV